MALLGSYTSRRFLRDQRRGRRAGGRSSIVGRARDGPRGGRRNQRRRGRFGLFGPVPYYSTRTRRGSRVTVGGCCLPLALSPVAASALLLRLRLRGR
jgi:hypothetical protein